MGTRIYWNDIDKAKIIKMYNERSTLKEIANLYCRNQKQIARDLREWGVRIRSSCELRKCYCNDNYFSVIDTERKAYWLGLLAADGNVYGNKLTLSLSFNNHNFNEVTNDQSHILLFRDDLESTYAITFKNNEARTCIYSWQIINDLYRYGIHENKSLTCTPAKLDKELMRHYWRGVIDGDGCLEEDYKRITLVGSEYIIRAFKEYCLAINGKIRADITYQTGNYRFAVSKNMAKPILNDLYGNSTIALPRKYKVFEKIMEKENEED